jgi:RNA polymerase sigma-70 factor (sigma-E family)
MTTGRRRSVSSAEDELMFRLYQGVTQREAARFAFGYDMAAGLDRYRTWLDEHTVGDHAGSAAASEASRQLSPELSEVEVASLLQASMSKYTADVVMRMGGSSTLRQIAMAARPRHMTETLIPNVALGSVSIGLGAERAVTELYSAHCRSLIRLAALLVRDVGTAEQVVQDSFVAMHRAWPRLRDSEKALSYLRQSVVTRSRSLLRQRPAVDRNAPKPAPDEPSADYDALALVERPAVIEALRTLPARQREALVLRFYADMSEAQIADTMAISRGAVKSHTARAMQALRAVLEREA